MGDSGPGEGRDDGTSPESGTVTSDRLAAAVKELYGSAPDTFTERRGELAAAARAAGDRAAAKAIGALRRPTRAAWVVNRLARTDPSAPPKLAELATALSAAQQAGHGLRLRELSAARGALVDSLTSQALRAADVPDPPPSLRLEVAETLTAALADPQVAADFAAGTLTRAAQWSGFGVLPAAADDDASTAAGPDASPGSGGQEAAEEGRGRHLSVVPDPGKPGDAAATAARPRQGAAPRAEGSKAAAAARPGPEATAQRQAEEEERLAREAAEREARRREQYADAERTAASTSAAAIDAVAAEDRLEAQVRDLEQQLVQARADLSAARMRARHAEAAERRARQALDRLLRD